MTCIYCIQSPKRFYLGVIALLLAYNTTLPIHLPNTTEVVQYALHPYNITHISLPNKHFFYVRESDPYTYNRTPYWQYHIKKQQQPSIIVLASTRMQNPQQLTYFINHSPIQGIYAPHSDKPCNITESDGNQYITCFTTKRQCRCIALINGYGYILSPYETYSTHQFLQ